jgi:arginine/ornithine N-succinyltransferase beta subunit
MEYKKVLQDACYGEQRDYEALISLAQDTASEMKVYPFERAARIAGALESAASTFDWAYKSEIQVLLPKLREYAAEEARVGDTLPFWSRVESLTHAALEDGGRGAARAVSEFIVFTRSYFWAKP